MKDNFKPNSFKKTNIEDISIKNLFDTNLHDLIDINAFQELQDNFCANFDLNICLYNTKAFALTKHDEGLIFEEKSDYIKNIIIDSIGKNNPVFSNFNNTNLNIASIPFWFDKKQIGTWIIFEPPKNSNYKNKDDFEIIVNFYNLILKNYCAQISKSHFMKSRLFSIFKTSEAKKKSFENHSTLDTKFALYFKKYSFKEAPRFVVETIVKNTNIDLGIIVLKDFEKECFFMKFPLENEIIDDAAFSKELKLDGFDFKISSQKLCSILSSYKYEYVTIPIISSGNWIGYICVASSKKENLDMNELDLSALNSVANTFADFYLIESMKNTLVHHNETFDVIINDANLWISAIDADSKEMIFINKTISDYISMMDNTIYTHMAEEIFNNISYIKNEFLNSQNKEPVLKEYFNELYQKWFLSTASSVKWLNGNNAIVEIGIDISNEKEKEEIINNLIWYDKITGVQGKSKLMHDLNHSITKNQHTILTLISINDFKKINEIYSYEFGNNFLIMLAKYFSSFIGPYCDVYHIDGDEFAFTSRDDNKIDNIITTISNRFEHSWTLDSVEFYCSINIGVSSYPNDTTNYTQLVENVNKAVAIAKERGKNMIIYFDDKENRLMLERFHFERKLINSVMKEIDQFILYYQPLVDASTGKIISMEALVRWIEPDLGFVNPTDFISVAEKIGMICKIDTYVLFQACAFTKKLHAKGFGDLSIHVNLSVAQIYEENITEKIQDILYKNNLDPKFLTLEVTESLAMSNVDLALMVLNKIKTLNIKLALDDFGTGFSSLGNLKILPVDTLKIDRLFVNDIQPGDYNYTFIKTIIELAHCTNIKVCCEGIEENAQWQQLIEFSCDSLQGYYFSRPVPESSFITVLNENKLLYEQL